MIAAGQLIGNYRIVQKIGTGGMGAVYLAEHPMIGKKVALKVIHRELASNKEVVQRFFQEARAVNKIGNEHIVEIHDFGVTPEGDHFYIMEYLEGRTLASVLAREPVMENMRALHIGAQIAHALAAAHANGVIHRDLKPDNIMLMTRLGDPDFVKVLDFGLAKMFQASGASAVQTAAGVLLGTPQYMSPEACESKRDIDHRTDIYALGILLFQMMCGVLPFDGESMGEVLVKQVTQLPPVPRAFNPRIPPAVEQVLLRCLAKQADARFQTMQQLREALLDPEAYLRASPPIAPARSVAPGEAKIDAKTVMAYVAQEQKTRIGFTNDMPLVAPPSMPGSASQQTMIGDGMLVPPRRATTQGPDMAVPSAPKTNTMRIATPLGYTSRPPKRVWPIVLVIALLLGLGGGAFAVAYFGRKDQPGTGTGSGSDTVAQASGAAGSSGSDTGHASGSDTGHPSGSDTGHAASGSDTGHASGSDTGHASGSDTGHASGSDTGHASGSDTGHAGSNAHPHNGSASVTPIPTEKLAVVVIDSMPQGADVFDTDGKPAGKTPTKLSLPITSKQLTYELRMAGYRKKSKQFVVSGNAVIEVTLERAPVIIRHNGSGGGSAKHCDTCLERPD